MNTQMTNQPTKINGLMIAGLIAAFVSLVTPALLTAFVLPIFPQHISLIMNVNLGLSYAAAASVGLLVFGIYRRYFVKE